jgi:glutamyl-tRNA synthetase
MPKAGETSFLDLIRGKVSFKNELVDDQVLIKSDGFPTYHLAVVVDDHLMKITHIVRGEEWISSTPKHIQLYKYFDWEIPQFAHLPLLLNSDKSKLSKRQGDVAVNDYQNKGYLPEALINFVALLGWNPGDDQEIFSLKELIQEFKIEKINKSGAIFNLDKLNWLNGSYLRQMDIKDLTQKCLPYLIQSKLIKSEKDVNLNYLQKIVKLEQERLKHLDEIIDLTHFFFKDKLNYQSDLLIWKKSDREHTLNNLSIIKDSVEKIDSTNFNKENLEKILMPMAQDRGVGDVLWPMRVALCGEQNSPGPFEIAEVLGKKESLKRIVSAIKLLEK